MRPLARESVELLDAARAGDDPQPADRERMRRRLVQAGVGAAVMASAGVAAGGMAAGASGGAAASVTAKAASGAAAGIGAAASAGAGGGLATAAGSSVVVLAAKVIAAVVLVGGIGAAGAKGVSAYRAHATSPEVTVSIVSSPAATPRAAATVPLAPAAPVVALSPVEVPDLSAPSAPIVLDPTKGPAVAQVRPAPGRNDSPALRAASDAVPSTLEIETRLLRDAEVAMRSGDPSRALALLDEHAARFPNGVLGEERAAERVLALCALGRTQDARADTQRFLRERPRSPLADRVRASCVGPEAR